MNLLYERSMSEANDSISHLDGSYPKLLLHIYRDITFGEVSGELEAVSTKLNYWVAISSFLRAVLFLLIPKRIPTVICVQENLFNSSLIERLESERRYTSLLNPVFGLKCYARFLAAVKVRFNSRLIAKYGCAMEKDPIFRRSLVAYYTNIIHVSLLKKKVDNLYYFSLGAPSYGRYISSKFHEVQHGVLHACHPAVNSIKLPKGSFLIYSEFEPLVQAKKDVYNNDDTDFGMNSELRGVTCFPPLASDSEREVEQYVRAQHDAPVFHYHPRSLKFSHNSKVAEKAASIRGAKVVYSGVSSTIRDIYLCRKERFKILVTKEDIEKLGVASIERLPDRLAEIYKVPIKNSQIVCI